MYIGKHLGKAHYLEPQSHPDLINLTTTWILPQSCADVITASGLARKTSSSKA